MIRSVQHRAEQKVSGFQSPAADYLEGRLDITDILINDPHCTFYFKMEGDAMTKRGLKSGDILIIDRSLKPVKGSIVIGVVGGSFYCRSYEIDNNKPVLIGDDGKINIAADEVLQIWGIVTFICRNTLAAGLRKEKGHVRVM